VQLKKLEAAAGNLLGQLGALCATQLRKATILQGMPHTLAVLLSVTEQARAQHFRPVFLPCIGSPWHCLRAWLCTSHASSSTTTGCLPCQESELCFIEDGKIADIYSGRAEVPRLKPAEMGCQAYKCPYQLVSRLVCLVLGFRVYACAAGVYARTAFKGLARALGTMVRLDCLAAQNAHIPHAFAMFKRYDKLMPQLT